MLEYNIFRNLIFKMVIKKYKAYTPSRRFMTWYDFSEITTNKPNKGLVKWKKRNSWRNNQWRVTSRFRWWWHKKLYRTIDFKWFDKVWIKWKVVSIEYDPFRTSRIVLVSYFDWEKRYLLAWKWVKVWDIVENWKDWAIVSWNRKQLKDIPEWVNIFNLEVTPFTRWKLIKSAWNYSTIMWKDEMEWLVFIKLPSWEVRKFNENCRATLWEVSNEQHKNIVIWKAWRSRWKWKKWKVLWVNMNPVDHPHWWWEWHAPIGLRKWPKSFTWRVVAPWIKTRKKNKWSDKFIVSRRKK